MFTTNQRRRNKTRSAPQKVPTPSTTGSQTSLFFFCIIAIDYNPGPATPIWNSRSASTPLHQTPRIRGIRLGRKTVRFASLTPIPIRLLSQDNASSYSPVSGSISPTPSPIFTLPELRISSKGRKIRAPERWEP